MTTPLTPEELQARAAQVNRRQLHNIALSIDFRYAVDDQADGIPHAGNLYRLLPADYAEQLDRRTQEKTS